MAGAGAKLFVDGTILDAVGINTYLMDQTIMRFATTTARDAAFGGAGEPVLAEGMFAYTDDTNTLWFYTGSAWEVATIKPSLVDAKGDLIAGTAADTVDRLAVGTNGQVLTANSSTSTGLAWALPRIVQVVQATLSTTFTTTSTSYVTTGLTATITPSSTSSLVLVMYSGTQAAASGHDVFTTVFRGTTAGTNLGTANGFVKVYSTAGGATNSGASAMILDTPATTSAQVYTVAMKTSGGSGYWSSDTTRSSITLMEISA